MAPAMVLISFNFLFLMILFHFARFGHFSCFVSVVLLVSVISFRWFCFVVSGFNQIYFLSANSCFEFGNAWNLQGSSMLVPRQMLVST